MKKREYPLDVYGAMALAMNIDPKGIDLDSILTLHRTLVTGADRLLEIGLRDVEPGFAVTPGKEWR